MLWGSWISRCVYVVNQIVTIFLYSLGPLDAMFICWLKTTFLHILGLLGIMFMLVSNYNKLLGMWG